MSPFPSPRRRATMTRMDSQSNSYQELVDDPAADIRQPEVASLRTVGQPGLINGVQPNSSPRMKPIAKAGADQRGKRSACIVQNSPFIAAEFSLYDRRRSLV